MKRTEVLYLRIDQDVVFKIREIAEANDRSMNNVTNVLLKRALNLPEGGATCD